MRRISLGEYVEDLEIEKRVAEWLGLPVTKTETGEVKIGYDRLGSENMWSNFGVSQIAILSLLLLIILIIILLLVCKKCCCSQSPWAQEKVDKIKRKVFYNPLLRFTLFNAMKFNMIAMLAFLTASDNVKEIAIAVLILLTINTLPILYAYLLYKNRANLIHE